MADHVFSPMPPAPETRVEQMLQDILPQVKQQLRTQHYLPPTDVCLLADAGQTITYLLDTLAEVATVLSEGDAAADYIDIRLEEPPQDGRLDDLDMDLVDYLEDKHAALKYATPLPLVISAQVARISRASFFFLMSPFGGHFRWHQTIRFNAMDFLFLAHLFLFS